VRCYGACSLAGPDGAGLVNYGGVVVLRDTYRPASAPRRMTVRL